MNEKIGEQINDPTPPFDGAALEDAPPAQTCRVLAYRVLARKYRPTDFTTLIGQDALVRTLSNAMRTGRVAQAYMLTGVRGVGKTTAARIIARCLNCTESDGPTAQPCGVCEHCRAIAEDRHVDVFEMDAASRTGVGDIRDLIESVRYRPTSARYKIYIIDEVHMLSTGAFNALLKTLEEPPEHVKFIFATTEIRKVPVTVLSRCQRFDLRRVNTETLITHFAHIGQSEGVVLDEGALRLLARAADGSVRDGLSLLDQAIAQAGSGRVSEQQVRLMLGLADRGLVFDLFDAVMQGDIKTALNLLEDQYAAGADPLAVLNDILEVTHWLTRLKVTPHSANDPMVAEAERVRGRLMADRLMVSVLTRTWQMVLKGVAEARTAKDPLQAVEMCLIRLAYAADLPTPAEALSKISTGGAAPPSTTGGSTPLSSLSVNEPVRQTARGRGQPSERYSPGTELGEESATVLSPHEPNGRAAHGTNGTPPRDSVLRSSQEDTVPKAIHTSRQASAQEMVAPETFEKLVEVFKSRREAVLQAHMERDVHVVHYDGPSCRLDFRPTDRAPADLARRISKVLTDWTGRPWTVMVSTAPGEPTMVEQMLTGARANPLVQAAMAVFPKASIGAVRDLEQNPPPLVPTSEGRDDSGGDYGTCHGF